MNIVDLAKDMHMNAPTPEPTEKFQIVIMWTSPQVPTIHRFNSVKKGMAAFKDLRKAWEKWIVSRLTEKASPRLYSIDGDMFFSCVDLYQVAQISYVDLAKRAKFVPAQ